MQETAHESGMQGLLSGSSLCVAPVPLLTPSHAVQVTVAQTSALMALV